MGKAHATVPTSPDRLRHFKKYNECKQKPLYLQQPSFPRRRESIGNPKKQIFKNSCRNSKVDSRLRGNDGKQISRRDSPQTTTTQPVAWASPTNYTNTKRSSENSLSDDLSSPFPPKPPIQHLYLLSSVVYPTCHFDLYSDFHHKPHG